MKNAWIAFALFLVVSSQAQKAAIVRKHTPYVAFPAKVGEREIEIFLRTFKAVEGEDFSSVKGWYWYKDERVKIPVVGLYDGNLTLFRFADAKLQKRILALRSDKKETGDKIADLQQTKGFDEKLYLELRDDKISGQWQKGDNKLPILTPAKFGFPISQRHDYLKILDKNGTTHFTDLCELYKNRCDFSLIGFHEAKTGSRALVSYAYRSSFDTDGYCGAGYEQGYVTLRFDSRLQLLSSEEVQTNSCLEDIYSEKFPGNPSILTISGKGKIQKWKLDAKNAQITTVK